MKKTYIRCLSPAPRVVKSYSPRPLPLGKFQCQKHIRHEGLHTHSIYEWEDGATHLDVDYVKEYTVQAIKQRVRRFRQALDLLGSDID
jgi:hypothetical protein